MLKLIMFSFKWTLIAFIGIVYINADKLDAWATLFDSNGRLHQVEYAFKASTLGQSIIAARSDRFCAILSWNSNPKLNMIIRKSHQIIHEIGKYKCFAASGVAADVEHLTSEIFDELSYSQTIYGTELPVPRLANFLAELFHEKTMKIYHRPYGVKAIIAGYDDISNMTLFEVDPLGNCHSCKVSCIGRLGEDMIQVWPKDSDPITMSAVDIVRTCLQTLSSVANKEELKINPEDICLCIVGENLQFRQISLPAINDIIVRGGYSRLEEELLQVL